MAMRLLGKPRLRTRATAGVRSAARPRVFVLGLDGTPCSWLRAETAAGRLPNLAALFQEGSLVPLRSSLPSVSSTAWTTFFTGSDAGAHGVFGFTDCRPDSHDLWFPDHRHVQAPAVWDVLARAGKRSVVLNVPGTYPARPIEGVLVSGFVAPSIERAVHPPALLGRLRALGYRIDLDAWAARGSVERLEEDLFATFDRRVAAIRMLLKEADWDLFIAVVTETDRLYHFLWNAMEAGEPRAVDLFERFHAQIDRFAGELAEELPPGTRLVSMSDHGFTRERVDVFTNAWLRQRGHLAFDVDQPTGLGTISPGSTVFSLDPGRFYVNRAGRRPRGAVPAGEVTAVVERLLADLLELRDPGTGELAYGEAVLRDDAYHGPQAPSGPDVILRLKPGYELKASVKAQTVFGPPAEGLGGMHTEDDAYLYVRGAALRTGPFGLEDLAPTIAELLEVEHGGFQGRSLLSAGPAGVPR
jgi:predicted AlkP superfamily phosphohydrolase/phosphomutase